MKFVFSLVILGCAVFEARGYPYAYYPSYGNVDTLSYGDSSRGGMALSRYYNPYYNPHAVGGGMASFMFRQPEVDTPHQTSQYYMPDRRRQTPQDPNFNVPPQQNEVYYPQPEVPVVPESPIAVPTETIENADPTEKAQEVAPTTEKAVSVPELIEPEVEEVPEEEPVPVQKPKKSASAPRRKQVKKPVYDEDEEDYAPKMPTGAYFPMFFGYGGRAGGGAPSGGPIAIANAYSTARGGVASSHATAYGAPRPEERYKN